MWPLHGLGSDGGALGVTQPRPQTRAPLLDPLHNGPQTYQDHEYQHALETKKDSVFRLLCLCICM